MTSFKSDFDAFCSKIGKNIIFLVFSFLNKNTNFSQTKAHTVANEHSINPQDCQLLDSGVKLMDIIRNLDLLAHKLRKSMFF